MRKVVSRRVPCLVVAVCCVLWGAWPLRAAQQPKTHNILFVMSDGVRWEEMFHGAEADLISRAPGGVVDPPALKREFDRPTAEARREVLFPFLWTTLARRGQLFGNRDKGSYVRVTNGKYFSYPGYSETLCGYVDPSVNSNSKRPNPNRTVLEWLYRKPQFEGKVAAFAAWNVFPYIFNRERCGFYVNAGYEPMLEGEITPKIELLNTLKAELPKHWDEEPFDAITFHTAMEYFRLHEPRIFYLALGETDDWCHDGRYDEYLWAAHRADKYIETLWNMLQSNPRYRDTTTLIVSTDHGRGHGPVNWKSHSDKYAGSENIWVGVLGPDTPALGERANCPALTQGQIAATLARFLGEDYCAAVPKAAAPIRDVFPPDSIIETPRR
jgi:Type I phosphodiesterase / nucleotide pyrophosphatase